MGASVGGDWAFLGKTVNALAETGAFWKKTLCALLEGEGRKGR
jgi:hypothetical protein